MYWGRTTSERSLISVNSIFKNPSLYDKMRLVIFNNETERFCKLIYYTNYTYVIAIQRL